jgi:predicted chitinase
MTYIDPYIREKTHSDLPTCPLCECPKMTLKKTHNPTTNKDIFYWTCEECPAILMEYTDPNDATSISQAIEGSTGEIVQDDYHNSDNDSYARSQYLNA